MTINLNLACGNNYLERGWINLDNSPIIKFRKLKFLFYLMAKLGIISEGFYNFNFKKHKWSKNTIIANVLKKIPVKDNYADYIYCSHFVEHLDPGTAKKFLTNCRRKLKSGGVIRIIVPDFREMFRVYLKKEGNYFGFKKKATDLDYSLAVNNNIYNTTYFDYIGSRTFLMKLFEGRNRHKWMYDYVFMEHLLREIGFKNIRNCKRYRGKCPDIKKLDKNPCSLFVEAEK